MGLRILAICGAIMIMLGACAGPRLATVEGRGPGLVMERYFDRPIVAYGVFEGRNGALQRTFKATIDGEWDGRTLTLDEDFFYDDGETGNRIWRIEKIADGQYVGRADDVVGEAQIVSAGAGANLKYVVEFKTEDGGLRVRFDDWLYLLEDDVVINRAFLTKFGVRVGEVSLVMMPADE
ncbi:MAG: DUF3833 domain-containing protein [Pseudomonadota bacterium]